ncbi:helix-turn-helix domain-containing protein [Streptomyces sp. NBC_00536]|uniref:helix-turn-helix domain-containing protein n=1 Tax=Streptomyces sp. NBC_00536 TaxID=2975769 RepID=UPI002E80C922|nr:helix-turn-helix domain-containing protein [Streptomyces sp. NBC_00536]WUC80231.1 helix-turn-helix domain-containing protein [Streptomyces sp. NBC_00536]
MALTQLSADPRPTYGVQHANVRLTSRFTVLGNQLLQDPGLSMTARGLAGYIQSLRPGVPISIEALAKVAPEGKIRIASALRELEAAGYLKRVREQLPDGTYVTRTISYNHPRAMTRQAAAPRPAPKPKPAPEPVPQAPEPEPEPEPVQPEPVPQAPEPEPEPVQPEPAPEPEAAPEPEPEPEAPEPEPEATPHSAAVRRASTDILIRLRRVDSRLLLGARDIESLAPRVEPWLERASPDAIIAVLTARLPHALENPAGLIAHRLREQLPPRLEPERRRANYVPPDPFQSCVTCDLAYRAPAPGGQCRDCREDGLSPSSASHPPSW